MDHVAADPSSMLGPECSGHPGADIRKGMESLQTMRFVTMPAFRLFKLVSQQRISDYLGTFGQDDKAPKFVNLD